MEQVLARRYAESGQSRSKQGGAGAGMCRVKPIAPSQPEQQYSQRVAAVTDRLSHGGAGKTTE